MAAIRNRDPLELIVQRYIGDGAIAVIEIDRYSGRELVTDARAELIGEVPVARVDDCAIAPLKVGADLPHADPAEDVRRHAEPGQARHIPVVDHIAEKCHPSRAAAECVFSPDKVGHVEPEGGHESAGAVIGVIEFALKTKITESITRAGTDVVASAGAQYSCLAAALGVEAPRIRAGDPARTAGVNPPARVSRR